ncbi:unnamed protein product [marine sediment metagenome]|uniref:Uncharacterized protein n=1 Tax=marine sediment metagenome TaxID=412755 RepID=X1RFL2_9ZZZZ
MVQPQKFNRADELAEAFKNRKITKAERAEFSGLLGELRSHDDFILKDWGTEHDFDQAAYARLIKLLGRGPKLREVPAPERALTRQVSQDYSKFLKGLWEETRQVGQDVAMRWMQTAAELGFWDDENDRPRFREFVSAAINFFVENRLKVPELKEEVARLDAVAYTLAQLSKPEVVRLMVHQSYLRFLMDIVALEAGGVKVPEDLILEAQKMTVAFVAGDVEHGT